MTTAIEKFQKFEDLLMLQISHLFNDYEEKRFSLIQKIFILITRLGDGYLYPVIFSLAIIYSNFSANVFITFITAFIVERFFYFFIKNFTKRIRPFERLKINNIPILPPDKYSFPSGHTSAAFLFATLMSIFFPFLQLYFFVFAILVGLSRIILNLHYPTDVLIGSQIGISIAVLTNEIVQILTL